MKKIKFIDLRLIDNDILRIDTSKINSQTAESIIEKDFIKLTFDVDSLLFKPDEKSHQDHVNKLKNCNLSHLQLTYDDDSTEMITLPWHAKHKDINAYETIFVSPNLISILVEVR